MGAVVELVITASDSCDLGEAIGEQMIALNARYWDDSDDTCGRVLAWLRDENGAQPATRKPSRAPTLPRDA